MFTMEAENVNQDSWTAGAGWNSIAAAWIKIKLVRDSIVSMKQSLHVYPRVFDVRERTPFFFFFFFFSYSIPRRLHASAHSPRPRAVKIRAVNWVIIDGQLAPAGGGPACYWPAYLTDDTLLSTIGSMLKQWSSPQANSTKPLPSGPNFASSYRNQLEQKKKYAHVRWRRIIYLFHVRTSGFMSEAYTQYCWSYITHICAQSPVCRCW